MNYSINMEFFLTVLRISCIIGSINIMKIVISGAGDVGAHLVEKLSLEEHDITIIELDQTKIDYISSHFDVGVVNGDCLKYKSLLEAGVDTADLYIAVTHTEELNLLSGIYAKKLGAKKVIARVDYYRSRSDQRMKDLYSLGIDEIISPNTLVSKEIVSLITQRGLSDIVKFEHGKLQLAGLVIKEGDSFVGKKAQDIFEEYRSKGLNPIAIQREDKTISIKNGEIYKAGDSAYFVVSKDGLNHLIEMTKSSIKPIERIVIVGGTLIGVDVARRLQDKYKVTLVESKKDRCMKLAIELENTLVVNGDSHDSALLEDIGMADSDAVIAVTEDVEKNIITCLYSKEMSDVKTFALVKDAHYIHATQSIGVDTLINKKIIAADFISRHIRQGKIIFVASIPGVDMEVVDFEVDANSKVINKQILDKDLFDGDDYILIGGVVRKDDVIIPDQDFIFKLGDRVVAACFGNCNKISNKCF